MSLSAQVAVGPSRALAALEAILLAGALVISTASVAARATPSELRAAVAASMVLAAVLAVLLYRRRMSAAPRRLVLGDGVATTWSQGDRTWHGLIGEGTLAWPGFVVLSLSSDDGRAGRRPALVLPVLRAELHVEAGRQLHRLVLWLSRSGHAAGASAGAAR